MPESKVEDSFKDLMLTLIKKVEALERPHFCEYKNQIQQQTVDIAIIKEVILFLKNTDREKYEEYSAHIEESKIYRKLVDEHELTIKELRQLKYWMAGVIVTVIGSLIIAMLTIGAYMKQIDVNTKRIDVLEELHPRIVETRPNVLKG